MRNTPSEDAESVGTEDEEDKEKEEDVAARQHPTMDRYQKTWPVQPQWERQELT